MSPYIAMGIGALVSSAVWLAAPEISLFRHLSSAACLITAIYLAAWYIP